MLSLEGKCKGAAVSPGADNAAGITEDAVAGTAEDG